MLELSARWPGVPCAYGPWHPARPLCRHHGCSHSRSLAGLVWAGGPAGLEETAGSRSLHLGAVPCRLSPDVRVALGGDDGANEALLRNRHLLADSTPAAVSERPVRPALDLGIPHLRFDPGGLRSTDEGALVAQGPRPVRSRHCPPDCDGPADSSISLHIIVAGAPADEVGHTGALCLRHRL